jgi:hypothetical protein
MRFYWPFKIDFLEFQPEIKTYNFEAFKWYKFLGLFDKVFGNPSLNYFLNSMILVVSDLFQLTLRIPRYSFLFCWQIFQIRMIQFHDKLFASAVVEENNSFNDVLFLSFWKRSTYFWNRFPNENGRQLLILKCSSCHSWCVMWDEVQKMVWNSKRIWNKKKRIIVLI